VQQKKEVVTTGAGTAGYAKQTGRPICDGQKSEEKHCFSLIPRLNGAEQPAMKGGEID